jgi:hypothetical protein
MGKNFARRIKKLMIMKIKLFTYVGLLCFFCQHSQADQRTNVSTWSEDIGHYVQHEVSATNGLRMGFIPYATHSFTNNIYQPIWFAFSLTNNGGVIYIPQDSYLAQVSLLDTNGRPLAKTDLGKRFMFLPIAKWDRNLMRQSHNGPRPWSVHDGWSNPVEMPSPKDLFVIQNPGEYKLILEVQVYLKIGADKELVRFPPLAIPVMGSGRE